MSSGSYTDRTKLAGLKVYGRMPAMLRQRLVRTFKPSYTVGSMTAVTRDDGAVLWVRHSYDREWSLPGGLVNRREPIEIGAVRETREECGIEVELVGEPAVTVDPHRQIVRIIYRARLADGFDPADARPVSQEIAEVRWFVPGTVPDVSPFSADALEALVRSEGRRG